MKLAVLGAGGGLGRNTVDAARAAGHEVVALVREPARAELPPDVEIVRGDAARIDDVAAALAGCDAAVFCVNPPFATWATRFPPLLEAAIEGGRRSGARVVFPANVWIYGPGRPDDPIDERRTPSPASDRGRLRLAMERRLAAAGIEFSIVRLPEFYGPSVVTLTAYPFRAALAGKRAWWPGRLDVAIELVYMPDAARAMVAVATAANTAGQTFHLPGVRTTPRAFVTAIFAAAGVSPRLTGVPRWVLSAAGVVDATIRGVADIGHLWTDPVMLDGTRYRERFGDVPQTPLAEGIAATLVWHRAHPALALP